LVSLTEEPFTPRGLLGKKTNLQTKKTSNLLKSGLVGPRELEDVVQLRRREAAHNVLVLR
jgi:hypothetical protein